MIFDPTRVAKLQSWYADWSGLKVAVLGLGVAGFAVADTLAELGCVVSVVAAGADADHVRLLDVIGARFVKASDIEQAAVLDDLAPELVIISPGFPPTHPAYAWAGAHDVPVWGEIELAWRLRDKVSKDARWLLVTGTNGKTTTTLLTATMIAEAGIRVAPCGNIGTPVLDAIRDPDGFDVLVIELSSHQLHSMPTNGPGAVLPHAAVCLNVESDHLQWHGSFEAYVAAKAKVYANTVSACVYNVDDAKTLQMVEEADVVEGARAIGFTLGVPGLSEFGVVEGILCERAFGADRKTAALELTTVQELAERNLAAPHLVADVLAASALARSIGVLPEEISRALAEFVVSPHRIQLVAEHGGVRFVDDSKATNAAAADASLAAYDSVVWVVGGDLKGIDIAPLIDKHLSRLRGAIVIGAEREPVIELLARHAPNLPVREVRASDTKEIMSRVAQEALGLASQGDTVLLAPAAASLDQFDSYSQRGNLFAAAVKKALEGEPDERTSGKP